MLSMRFNFPRIISFWLISVFSVSAELKTMTVDINSLYENYHVTQKAKAVLQNEHDAHIKQRQERRQSISQINKELKKVVTKLRTKAIPKVEKDSLSQQYKKLVDQYNTLSKDTTTTDNKQLHETKEKLAKARREGLNTITAVIKQFAKDNGYHWVMETSGRSSTQLSPLVFAKKTENKTEEILALLNKNAPEEEKEDELDPEEAEENDGDNN